MPYLRTVWPNGGSLCITLPRRYMRQLQWIPGDVTLVGMTEGGQLTVKKVPVTKDGKEVEDDGKPATQFPYNPRRSH